jgi:hypothetical protein
MSEQPQSDGKPVSLANILDGKASLENPSEDALASNVEEDNTADHEAPEGFCIECEGAYGTDWVCRVWVN